MILAFFSCIAVPAAFAGTISGRLADYNVAAVANASGALTVPGATVIYTATTTITIGASFIVTLPTGFSFASNPTLFNGSGPSTFTVASGGSGNASITYTVANADVQIADNLILGTFSVTGATALATLAPQASALPVTMQAVGTDVAPLSFPAFASAPGVYVQTVGAVQFTDPLVQGRQFKASPDSFTAVWAVILVSAQTTDLARGSAPVLGANGLNNTISGGDSYTATFFSKFRGYGQAFGSSTSNCLNPTPSSQGYVTNTSISMTNFPVNTPVFICVTGSGSPLESQPNGHTDVLVSPGTSTDFVAGNVASGNVTIGFSGAVCYDIYCNANPYVVSPPPPLQIFSLSSMVLSVVPNQSLVATGTATVVANQSAEWTATTATAWLLLTQATGPFPGVVAATANAAGLAAGSYTGSISVTSTVAGYTQQISIPVTLTVNSPAALTANPTAISMASSYPAGSATGFTLQTGAPGLAFTASTSASSAGWMTVSPASGIAPTPITVTLDPSKAIPGTYTDSIVVSSPGVASVSVPVKMAVSGIIATLPQQVNAATQAGPDHTVAPNELVMLYLTDFTCATAPVVSINGTAVSWSSYAPGQLNYAVPANITTPAALTVACNGTTAWTFNGLTAAAVVPGIFTLTGNGKGQADVVNGDGTLNGSTNPATRGSWLSVYGTGFGTFNAAGANGLRTLAGTVTATIGGTEAQVLYAGSAPGEPDAVQQFNLQIPASVPAGTAVPIVLTVNGTPTQTTATVSLK